MNMDNEIFVQVQQGTLRGSIYRTIYGSSYVAFLSVPYAAPPIGNLRFQDPQPPDSWEGILDCQTYKNNCCIQRIIWPRSETIGDEDCLYLNIYTKYRRTQRTGTAVMVWIHGGHYYNGSGNFYDAQPDYLMAKDIILVTVNYRLGAFGFLNLNHELASGNQGLKDQVAALKWIKENIAYFGGDPNNITLFGSSVGAICVHLLMLSPLSKDLFHKAILQSAVATTNWAIEDYARIESSYRLASILGDDSRNTFSVMATLQRASADDILTAQYGMLTPEELQIGGQLFGPSIDECSVNPFLPCSPRELLHNGNQKPVILGHTSLEYMRYLNETTQESLQQTYTVIPLYTKTFLSMGAPVEEIEKMGMQFQKYYFNNNMPTTSFLQIVLRCYSDILYNIPIKRIADVRRKFAEAPTYVYEFSYVGNQKIEDNNLYWYNVNLPVSTQNDDIAYLFYLPRYKVVDDNFPPVIRTPDFRMVQIMTNMWTNFAKKGNPTPFTSMYTPVEWKPATNENFYYLDIGKTIQLLTVIDYDRPLSLLM